MRCHAQPSSSDGGHACTPGRAPWGAQHGQPLNGCADMLRPKSSPAALWTRATSSTLCAETSWCRVPSRSSLAAPAPLSRCTLPSMGASGEAPTARSTTGSVARAGDPACIAKARHACATALACDAVRAGPVLLLCSAAAVPAAAPLSTRSCAETLSDQPLSARHLRTLARALRLCSHGSRGSRDTSAATRSSCSALLGSKPCSRCKMVTNKANSDTSKPLQPGGWPRALSTPLSTSGDLPQWTSAGLLSRPLAPQQVQASAHSSARLDEDLQSLVASEQLNHWETGAPERDTVHDGREPLTATGAAQKTRFSRQHVACGDQELPHLRHTPCLAKRPAVCRLPTRLRAT